jgi:hypothetical protein
MLSLSGCVSTKYVEVPVKVQVPAQYLADCVPEKVVFANAKPTTGDVLLVVDTLEGALRLCNEDKAAIRSWNREQ